ncbi:MAG: hypothetical protein GF313_09100 [Caldithrix sp.]|nr:hypothetical protein [Caldithrix sp.]
MTKKTRYIILLTGALVLIWGLFVLAADKERPQNSLQKNASVAEDPIVPSNWKFHEIGTLWSRVTNFGKTGDDAYENRTPSCDWPGGSGNSYLYRGSLWLGGKVNGTVHVTQPEDSEYAPLDSVHLIIDGPRGEQETYTRYYDVKAPLSSGHDPLGVEVTERTYAWSESYRDDFIIYEFTIKNVGIDSDDDGLPDTPRDINDFYFTYRLDGDVSKLPDWPTEGPFINQDDHAAVNSSWDILDLFPDWKEATGSTPEEIEQSLGKPDSSMMFMFDGDNPAVVADNGEDDDAFNPGVEGTLQSPGMLGIRILDTEPASFKVSSFHTNHIYNDPTTDQEAFDRMMLPHTFETDGPSGVLVDPNGNPFPNDYRAIISVGPLPTLAAGDSVKVTMALGVGCDPERGGGYSLMELVKIMDVAQYIVDNDYDLSNVAVAPAPSIDVQEMYNDDGVTEGVRILWDKSSEAYDGFYGYTLYKSAGKDASGAEKWQVMYQDSVNSDSWPPPTNENGDMYEIIDTDVKNGFDYKYAVKAATENFIFGLVDSKLNVQEITPANEPSNNLDDVKAVPNPYIGSAAWNNPKPSDTDPWRHRLQFINLPADATVKIFTLDLDFVAEVKAGQSSKKDLDGTLPGPDSVAEWDLLTKNEQEAAPGLYIYVVDSPSAGQTTGKFVIVR